MIENQNSSVTGLMDFDDYGDLLQSDYDDELDDPYASTQKINRKRVEPI